MSDINSTALEDFFKVDDSFLPQDSSPPLLSMSFTSNSLPFSIHLIDIHPKTTSKIFFLISHKTVKKTQPNRGKGTELFLRITKLNFSFNTAEMNESSPCQYGCEWGMSEWSRKGKKKFEWIEFIAGSFFSLVFRFFLMNGANKKL